MKRFSKKVPFEEAICPSCGEFKPTDLSPAELKEREWECLDCATKRSQGIDPSKAPEERGSKEVSKFDPEYEWLVKLISVVTKAGVPAQEIKALSIANPFTTIDDVGNLAAKIWTLATEKYHIPREWLIKKLPEKKGSLKKADLKEYSNEETKGINDFIIQHPKVMEVVIDAAKRATDEKSFTDWLQKALTEEGMEEGIRKAVKWEELGWAWFNTVNRETTEPTSTDVIEQLPTLDKKKKMDELLDSLSAETDPQKKEQIKQHIERIKRAKLLRADLWPAQEAAENTLSHEHNSLSYNPLQESDTSVSGPNPNTQREDTILWSLIVDLFFTHHERWSSVVKALKEANPALTNEDIALLKDRVRKSLDNQMGAIASKKEAKKKSLNIDKIVQVLNSKEPKVVRIDPIKALIELQDGSIISFDEAVDKAMELDKEGVFSGAEFSTDDVGVNPSMDSGPWSSPSDHGSTSQKLVWPNTNWLPMDDENKDEQPYSNVASSLNKKAHCGPCAVIKAEVIKMLADLKYKDESIKTDDLEELAKLSADPSNNSFIQELSKIIDRLPKEHAKEIQKLNNHKLALEDIQKDIDNGDIIADKPFSKKEASGDYTPYWISPKGTTYEVPYTHNEWVLNNADSLEKQLEIKIDDKNPVNSLEQAGWARVLISHDSIQIEVNDFSHLNQADNFVAKYWSPNYKLLVVDNGKERINLDDPFPSLEEAVNKARRHSFSKKARMDAPSWIDPNGKVYELSNDTHETWVDHNMDLLQNQYKINFKKMDPKRDSGVSFLVDNGWARASVGDTALVFQIKNIGSLGNLDGYVDSHWGPNFQYVLVESQDDGHTYQVNDPFPNLQTAIQKGKKIAKQAAISGEITNKILQTIHNNGGTTYNLTNGDMSGTPNFSVSVYPERERIVDGVDFDVLEGFIDDNEDLLKDPANSLGAWTTDGKIYLDVVVTIPDQERAIDLAKQNNQIAIWDLQHGREISTEVVRAFSKKEAVASYPSKLDTEGMRQFLMDNGSDAFGKLEYGDVKEIVPSGGEWILQDIPLSTFPNWIDFGGMKTKKRNPLPVVTLGPNFDWEVLDGKHRIAVANALGEKIIKGYVFNDLQQNVRVVHAEEQILTQEQQNQIAATTSPVYNIALNNYAEAVKRGHSKDRAFDYAVDSVKTLQKLNEKKLVELINTYLVGLVK